MHIGRCCIGVGDDAVPAIDGAVIEIEKPLWLAVAHHVTALRIGAGNLGLLRSLLAALLL